MPPANRAIGSITAGIFTNDADGGLIAIIEKTANHIQVEEDFDLVPIIGTVRGIRAFQWRIRISAASPSISAAAPAAARGLRIGRRRRSKTRQNISAGNFQCSRFNSFPLESKVIA